MPRDILTLIDSLLAVIPNDERPEIIIRIRLQSLKETCQHSPAENLQLRWHELERIVVDMRSPHFGNQPDWLKTALNIWRGE